VDAKPRKIVHHLDAEGNDHFSDWMKTLKGTQGFKKILIRVDRAEDGNLGDHSSVGDGVFEMRFHGPPGYRLYYGEDGDDLVLLTGGDKDTQPSDIAAAKEYWREYNA
jgi:putative addiction module killer protein